jgi:hypothetical protein
MREEVIHINTKLIWKKIVGIFSKKSCTCEPVKPTGLSVIFLNAECPVHGDKKINQIKKGETMNKVKSILKPTIYLAGVALVAFWFVAKIMAFPSLIEGYYQFYLQAPSFWRSIYPAVDFLFIIGISIPLLASGIRAFYNSLGNRGQMISCGIVLAAIYIGAGYHFSHTITFTAPIEAVFSFLKIAAFIMVLPAIFFLANLLLFVMLKMKAKKKQKQVSPEAVIATVSELDKAGEMRVEVPKFWKMVHEKSGGGELSFSYWYVVKFILNEVLTNIKANWNKEKEKQHEPGK